MKKDNLNYCMCQLQFQHYVSAEGLRADLCRHKWL